MPLFGTLANAHMIESETLQGRKAKTDFCVEYLVFRQDELK